MVELRQMIPEPLLHLGQRIELPLGKVEGDVAPLLAADYPDVADLEVWLVVYFPVSPFSRPGPLHRTVMGQLTHRLHVLLLEPTVVCFVLDSIASIVIGNRHQSPHHLITCCLVRNAVN